MSRPAIVPVRRRGFTLAEIIVVLAVLGVIGIAVTRLLLTQSRFAETEMGKRNARTVSRNAMNIMLTDLRMSQDNGSLIAANTDSVTLRVPLAFGLFCGMVSGKPVLSLLPVDSSMTGMGKYAGWAFRDSTSGNYTYTDAATIVDYTSLTVKDTVPCDSASGPGIASITYGTRTGEVRQMNDASAITPTPGWPVFVYQIITYKFDSSATFPGRWGLYRKQKIASGWRRDEIIAPFASNNNFRFFVMSGSGAAQATVPASLSTVRGLEMNLTGASSRTPQTSSTPISKPLVTAVFFKNRVDP